jgi:hypothetical protein
MGNKLVLLFHKLVRNNSKKGNDVIMDLNVNGKQYDGEENVMTGFREHFKNVATFDHIILFICVGFPLSFHILYFAFIILSADLISGVHIFSFGFAL